VLASATVEQKKEKILQNGETAQKGDFFTIEVAREVAGKISQKVIDSIFPARILAVIGNQITINGGQDSEFRPNDALSIYAQGKELIDPDTHESLGAQEILVGHAKVTEIKPKFTEALLTGENLGVQEGNIVRAESTPQNQASSESETKTKKDENW